LDTSSIELREYLLIFLLCPPLGTFDYDLSEEKGNRNTAKKIAKYLKFAHYCRSQQQLNYQIIIRTLKREHFSALSATCWNSGGYNH